MTSSAAGDGAPRAVVAGHGDFAAGIISAVQAITGKGDVFRGVSNAGLDAAALVVALRAAALAHGARLIFTDLPAGSCTIAAQRLARERAGLRVVTGANLPMLLEYAFKGGADALAYERVADRGRAGIAVAPAPGGGRAD